MYAGTNILRWLKDTIKKKLNGGRKEMTANLIPKWLWEFEREAGYNQRKVIYISAPYTLGDTAENVRNACLAGDEILRKGHIAFVPHLMHLWHLISPKPHQDWIDIDLALLPRMDALLRLPGESYGADREVLLAKALNIPVFYSLADIKDIANGL